MSEELATCQQLADGQGIKLKSFVFPGNNKGNLSTVKEYGFICYRLDRKIHIGNPFLDSFGLCAIPGGIFWEITPGWKVRDWTRIVEKCLDLALQKNMVLHLWFHPSCDEINIKQVFPEVMEYIKSRRNEIWVATMSDLAEYFLLEGK